MKEYNKETLCYCIDDFINKKKGYFPLPAATGQGKTWSSIEYINDNYENKKIFFITPLKINFPDKEINKRTGLREKTEILLSLFDAIDNFSQYGKLSQSDMEERILNPELISFFNKLKKQNKDNKELINDFNKSTKEFTKAIFHYYEMKKILSYNKNKNLWQTEQNKYKDEINKKNSIFKQNLKNILKNAYTDNTSKINSVLNEDKWEFIKILYPACQIYNPNKHLFIATVDKFILPIEPIIGPIISFLENPDFLKEEGYDTVLFIDEIDQAFKTIATQRYIEASQNSIGILKLASILCLSLKEKNIPTTLLFDKTEYEFSIIQTEIDKFLKKYPDFGKSCFKLDKNLQSVIFKDYFTKFFSENEKNEKRYIGKFNKKENKYIVTLKDFNENELEEDEFLLTTLINDISALFNSIIPNINAISLKYMKKENDKRKDTSNGNIYEEMTKDEALSSLLDFLGIVKNNGTVYNDPYFIFFKNRIKANENPRNLKTVLKNQGVFDYYNIGFNLFVSNKDNFSNEYDDIRCISLNSSPENILLHLCYKIPVIGMSATCKIDTDINNFSNDYLKKFLKKDYYEISTECKKLIKDKYNKDYNYPKNVINKIDIIKNEEYTDIDKLLIEVFGEEKQLISKLDNFNLDKDFDDFVVELFDKIREYFNLNEFNFKIMQIFKNLKAIKRMIKNEQKSILIFTTAGFDNIKKEILLKSILLILVIEEKIIDKESFLKYWCSGNFDKNEYIYFPNSEQIKQNDLDIKFKKSLSKGNTVIVFTSYNTIGAGQNLQYIIPYDDINTVIPLNERECNKLNSLKEKINKGELTKDKYNSLIDNWKEGSIPDEMIAVDFSASYFDEPTNIIPQYIKGTRSQFGEVTMLEQIDKINRLKEDGSINEEKAFKAIRYVIQGGEFISLKDSYATKEAGKAIVLQALGRQQRCAIKYPINCFYFDYEIASKYNWEDAQYELAENKVISDIQRNFKNLSNIIGKNKKEKKINCFINKNDKCGISFSYILSAIFAADKSLKLTKLAQEQYSKIGEFILLHPTYHKKPVLSYKSEIDGEIKEIDMSEYYYEFEKDISGYSFKTIINNKGNWTAISDFKEELSKTNGWETCSSSGVNIFKFIEIEKIKLAFKEAGMEFKNNSWLPGRYILLPAAFTGIYKGRLGELITKVVFKVVFNKELIDMPENFFEKFDFGVKHYNNIFIDAKLHNNNAFFDFVKNPKNDKKIFNKLKEISKEDPATAIIINVNLDKDKICEPDKKIEKVFTLITQNNLRIVKIQNIFSGYSPNILNDIDEQAQKTIEEVFNNENND